MRIVRVMSPDDRDETSEEPASRAGRPAGDAAPIPEPSPEEVPELLGERSDYPIPFGEDDAGAPREGLDDEGVGVPRPRGSDAEQPPA